MTKSITITLASACLLTSCASELNRETGIPLEARGPTERLAGEGIPENHAWSLPMWRQSTAKEKPINGEEPAPEQPATMEELVELRRDALEAHNQGRYARAAELWRKAIAIDESDPYLHLACAQSLAGAGDAEACVAMVRLAWAKGLTNRSLYQADDFDEIAQDPAWIGWLAEMDARAKQAEDASEE